ncbi:transposase, partial [Photobacterium nomapromontoriensis]
DKGYQSQELKRELIARHFVPHVRSRGEEKQDKTNSRTPARRWVVERSHSWLNRFRGLLIRWSKKAENYEAMLYFACGLIVWKKCLSG